MDSDEENRLLYYQEVKSHDVVGFDHKMIEDEKKKNQRFDHQESSDEVENISEKPISSSCSELHEGKSKSKIINGASGSSALASGSSVRVCDFCGKEFSSGKALGGHRRYHIQVRKKMEAQNQAQAQQQQQQEKVNRHHQSPSNNYYPLRIKPNNNISEDFVIGDDDNNPLIKSKNIGNLNNSSSRSFRCCVCDKDFPSKKSLFGHMRSHPEREWRGMNPPFTATDNRQASSSSPEQLKVEDQYHDNDDDDEANVNNNNNGSSSSTFEESPSVVVDLSLSCSGSSWLRKDRRGRKSIGAAEAAQTLMYIYLYGRYLRRHPPPPPREPDPEAVLLPVKKRKKKNVNDVVGSNSSPPGKQSLDSCKEKLEGSGGEGNDDQLEAAENNIWEMKVISLVKEKRKLNKKMNKKRKLLDPEDTIKSSEGELQIRNLKQEVAVKSSQQNYVCDICDKSFPSFQALGGHKSKHNRGKNIVISTKGKEAVEQSAAEEEEDKVCINGASLPSAGLLSCEEEDGEGEGEDKVCINGALLPSAGLLSCEEENGEEEGASLNSSEERLVISSNDNEKNSNEEEMGEASPDESGPKILEIDLNVPYVPEHEATGIYE